MIDKQRICAAVDSGMTRMEIAVHMGVSYEKMSGIINDLGLKPQRHGKKKYDRKAILAMRAAHMTYQEIGREFGITKQRVQQIVAREKPALCDVRKIIEPKYCAYCAKELPPGKRQNVCCSMKCRGAKMKSQPRKMGEEYLARCAWAMKRRVEGASYGVIADELGYSNPSTIPTMLARYARITGHDISFTKGFTGTETKHTTS